MDDYSSINDDYLKMRLTFSNCTNVFKNARIAHYNYLEQHFQGRPERLRERREALGEQTLQWNRGSGIIRDAIFQSKLVENDGKLSEFYILHALLNLARITAGKSDKSKHPRLAPFLADSNFYYKGISRKHNAQALKGLYKSVIHATNQKLDKLDKTFEVPSDIFKCKFYKPEQLYYHIQNNQKSHGGKLIKIMTNDVSSIHFSHYDFLTEFNINSINDDNVFTENIESLLKANLLQESVFDKISEFLRYSDETERGLSYYPQEFKQHIAYIVGGSNLLSATLLETYFEQQEHQKDSTILLLETSRIVNETSFLRHILIHLKPYSSPDRLELDKTSLHKLKKLTIEALAEQPFKNVVVCLICKGHSLKPKTDLFGPLIEREYFELLLTELCYEVNKTSNSNKAKAIVGVQGDFLGLNYDGPMRIKLPALSIEYWKRYCQLTPYQSFALNVIKNSFFTEVSEEVICALVNLDAMISFVTSFSPTQTYLRPDHSAFTLNGVQEYRLLKDDAELKSLDKFDWRQEMFEGIINHRIEQKFAKLIFYFFSIQLRRLDFYYLLVATALSDNGLKQETMFLLGKELGMHMCASDIEGFLKTCAPILVTIYPSTQMPVNDDFAANTGETRRYVSPEYEVMQPLRDALISFGDTYLHAEEYQQDVNAILSSSEMTFGNAKPRRIPREELSFCIAKLSLQLFLQSPGLHTQERKRRRIQYVGITVKHLLMAVGQRHKNERSSHEYTTLTQYLDNLASMRFDSTSAHTIINLAYKLFSHGLELQPQTKMLFEFYPNGFEQNDAITVRLLGFFANCGRKLPADRFHVPYILSENLNELSLLRLCNTAAVTHWNMAKINDVHNVILFFREHFARYDGTPLDIISQVLDGDMVRFLARESISRVSMIYIRSLLDSGQLGAAKELLYRYIKDIDLLIDCSLYQYDDLEKVAFNEDSPHIDNPRKNAQHCFKLEVLKEVVTKLLKRRLRHCASLLLIHTHNGNESSARRMFLEVNVMSQEPILFILRNVTESKKKNRYRQFLNDVQDMLVNKKSQHNRILHHQLYYLCMSTLNQKTEQAFAPNEDKDELLKHRYYNRLSEENLRLLNEKINNSAKFVNYFSIAKTADPLDSMAFEAYNRFGIAQGLSRFTFANMKLRTLTSIREFLVEQQELLHKRDVALLLRGETDISPNLKPNSDVNNQRFDDFYLTLSLARNTDNAKLFDNITLLKGAKNSYVRPEDRLLNSVLLRHSRQIRNRASLERYRIHVYDCYADEIKEKEYTSTHYWPLQSSYTQRLELQLVKCENQLALIELWLLSCFHMKWLCNRTDAHHLLTASENLKNKIQLRIAKYQCRLRDRDMQLLEKKDISKHEYFSAASCALR